MDNRDRTFRVAAASIDGYTVDIHFGRATKFYIYQLVVDEWVYVELRKLEAVCGGGEHDAASMRERAKRLSDCRYVTASRIGAGAESILQQNGIMPMALPGDLMEALDKIYSYNTIQNLFN
ncbi:MAG: hypothetical protein J6Y79_00100 [Paludibacteraceae bacterium]|nr:hypothetical protein [Paludibacteraceae bacterium]